MHTRVRTLVAATVGVAGVLGLTVGAVGAQSATDDVTLSYSLDTVVFAPEGSVEELVSTDIADDLVGRECTVTLTADNNDSVHPDNDLIITSGADEVVVVNVEAEAFVSITAEETLILGPTLTVSVRLGPDGVLSEGGLLQLSCSGSSPATTTPTTSPSTTPTTAGPEVEAAVQVAEVSPNFTG